MEKYKNFYYHLSSWWKTNENINTGVSITPSAYMQNISLTSLEKDAVNNEIINLLKISSDYLSVTYNSFNGLYFLSSILEQSTTAFNVVATTLYLKNGQVGIGNRKRSLYGTVYVFTMGSNDYYYGACATGNIERIFGYDRKEYKVTSEIEEIKVTTLKITKDVEFIEKQSYCITKDVEFIEKHVEQHIEEPKIISETMHKCNNIDSIFLPLEILNQLKAPPSIIDFEDRKEVEVKLKIKPLIKKRPRKDDHLKLSSIINQDAEESEIKIRRSSRLSNKNKK
jgi:hypothetical protein